MKLLLAESCFDGKKFSMLLVGLLLLAQVGLAAPRQGFSDHERIQPQPVQAMAQDKLDLESHKGFSDEYIFGLSKGVMHSTLQPAFKPAVLILTVPLDIVFLPFAAIGGLIR